LVIFIYTDVFSNYYKELIVESTCLTLSNNLIPSKLSRSTHKKIEKTEPANDKNELCEPQKQSDNKNSTISSRFYNFFKLNNLILILFLAILSYYFYINYSNKFSGLFTLILAYNINNIKLVSNFNLNSFYEYLNSLNLLELSALFHLLILSLICIFLINIISTVLGNEIINYFNLDQKYPKISKFLKIRLKFQRYYLILNFSLMFIFIITAIIMNILVLF
jgi:hypothetical protein